MNRDTELLKIRILANLYSSDLALISSGLSALLIGFLITLISLLYQQAIPTALFFISAVIFILVSYGIGRFYM